VNSVFGSSPQTDGGSILERPRVNALLGKAMEKPVVFVSAGEGYGKTLAVNFFLRGRKEAVIWIPFSERDNDPWHFWETVTKAVGFHNRRSQKIMEGIGFPESSGQLNRLFSMLQSADPDNKGRIVVADDCHHLRNGLIFRFFERLLSFLSLRTTFILISRTETGLNTVLLLSRGVLSRITSDDLRFNEDEIAGYFRFRDTPLSEGERKEILTDTEGWALAITLISEEMKRRNKKYSRSLLESGGFRAMEEALFASVPVSLQRFLVILSLFEQWPLEALEKIAASMPGKFPAMGELTENLRHLSSLIAYDTYLHGFRIHRVFLDFLREKQKELSPDETKTACAVTAQWCMDNNLRIDAAINYGMAGDYASLMRAIYAFPRLLPRSAASSNLEILDRVLDASSRNEKDGNFLFLRHVTRPGMLINLGRYEEARTAVNESIREFEALPPGRLSSWILSACCNTLGALSFITYRMSRDNRAPEYFQRGDYYYTQYPFHISGSQTKTNIGSYVNLIGFAPKVGEFENFIKIIAQCIPHTAHSIGGFLSGMDSLCLAELAFFRGDLNNAERHAREAVFRAREKEQHETESKGLFYLLRIHLCNGDAEAGRETWEQMEAQLEIQDYLNRYVIHDIMGGWFYAHIGKIDGIAPWLRNEFEESDLNLLVHNFETMVKAKSLFAEKRYQEALKFLNSRAVREGLGSFYLGMLEIAVLEATARSRLGDEKAALKALETAYEISAPNSFDMPFIELGEDMRILAGTALNGENRIIPKDWLETIRNKASVYAKKLALAFEGHRVNQEEKESPFLTSQEISILAGISQGFTREEIANKFLLSINTVKSIIKSIYDKLGALNRADAIRIAVKTGILK
jgi:LuxR family maltose regulon positive regulatory protein